METDTLPLIGASAGVDLVAALQDMFGFEAFRPGQEDLVRRALEGRSCLAVMPTGSGKSLCYQLPAMLRPTPTLVLSPLIALMKDQVENLPAALRDRATFINSTVDAAEAQARLQAVAAGQVKLLYAAPERLRQARFSEILRAARIGLVVVDEAHCVALWGHDFRPDYLFIRSVLEGPLRGTPVMAFTATATPAAAEEIGRAFGRDMDVVRFSVVRRNLRYEVVQRADEEERLRYTLERVAAWQGPGIVYVRARERCEQIAGLLQRAGVAATHYHAGLAREERAAAQEAFIGNRVRVVVATTAFGMGVDKPDVRWVLLYNYPTSLEEYVQQVGRAGRDGLPSTCTLLATPRDASNLRTFAKRDAPTVEELRNVWSALRAAARPGGEVAVTGEDLAAALPDGKDPRVHCGVLERAGLVTRHFDTGPTLRFTLLPAPADAASRIAELVEVLLAGAKERADRMIAFAEKHLCRHLQVAAHFGDRLDAPCGRCDVCAPSTAGRDRAGEAFPARREPPADPAQAIVDAVAGLVWPLGYRGLVALLRGSVAAPPSARRSPAFGVLEAVPAGTVQRWLEQLVEEGHLVRDETEDGFPVLTVGRREGLPSFVARGARKGGAPRGEPDEALSPDDEGVFAALRAWRAEEARRAGVPAYVILHDKTLRLLAQERPADLEGLGRIPGIGPRKLEALGEALLAVLARR